MAFNLDDLQRYIDETSQDLQYKILLGANTLQKSIVKVQPDVKTSVNLNTLNSTLVAVQGFCGFSEADTTKLSAVELKVENVQIDRGFCLKDLETKYTQIAFNRGSYQDTLPMAEVFMAENDKLVSELIEKQIWQGDPVAGTGNLGITEGFIYKLEEAGVGATAGGTFDSTTAIAKVDDYIDMLPDELLDVDTILYLSPKLFQSYINAAIDQNLYHINPVVDYYEVGIQHRGSKVKVFPTKGLSGTKNIILTYPDNLYVGLDMEEDPKNYTSWYENKDKKFYVSVQYKLGTAVLWPDHVVHIEVA